MIEYTYVPMKDEIINALRAGLAAQQYKTLRIIKADPKEAAEIPCICVNRADAGESNQVLGDVLDPEFDEESSKWVEYKGTFFSETMEIRIWHFNSDERENLYLLMQAILFDMKNALAAKGVHNVKLRGGRDEQDNTMMAQPLYWAAIHMDYLNPLQVSVIINDESDIITRVDSVFTAIQATEGS